MKKAANKIVYLLSIFLVTTIGIMFFVYVNNQKRTMRCGTVNPQAICGTNSMLTEKSIQGKNIFNANCAACHKLYKRMTGPSLKGLVQNDRYPSKEYFFEYIRNEQKLIDGKDKYAKAINEKYSLDYQHNFKLSDLEVEQLLEYIAE